MAASHSAWPGWGAWSATKATAASWRVPVGSPAPSRSIRPRGGSGVARVTPASSRARRLTQALWPSVDSSSTGRSATTASRAAARGPSPPKASITQPPPRTQLASGRSAA
jgi:hypothetical protein